MKAILDAAYNAIKRRHNNIPQETLPIEVTPVSNAKRKTGAKQRSPRSVRWENCSHCLALKPTGVIRLSDGSEVFRDHHKMLNSGQRILCAGSGKVAPS